VLGRIVAALAEHAPGIACAGTSDVVLASGNASAPQLLKCSGNSVRVKRRHLLYHGTLLYDFPIEQVSSCLLMPPRTPDYRAGRGHDRFLANLPLDRSTICSLLARAWSAKESANAWPQTRTASLAAGKYSRHTWNEYR
jgi:lipoate-protein ligase A